MKKINEKLTKVAGGNNHKLEEHAKYTGTILRGPFGNGDSRGLSKDNPLPFVLLNLVYYQVSINDIPYDICEENDKPIRQPEDK